MSIITQGYSSRPEGPPPGELPTLFAAVCDWVDLTLFETLPQGLAATRPGRKAPMPFAVFTEIGTSLITDARGSETVDGEFQIALFGTSSLQVRSVALELRAALRDPPLTYSEGRHKFLRASMAPLVAELPDDVAGGGPGWMAVLPFRYVYIRR